MKTLISIVLVGFLVGCNASRSHTLTKTVEIFDDQGNVTERRTDDFDSRISALNTRMKLSDFEFNETLGKDGETWSSSGGAKSVSADPETKAFETMERSMALFRGMQASQDDGRARELSPIEEVFINRILANEAQAEPALSDEDKKLLEEIPALRDDMARIRAALDAQE